MAGIGPILGALGRRVVGPTGAVVREAATRAASRTPFLLEARIPLRVLQEQGGEHGVAIARGIESARSTVERDLGQLLDDVLPGVRSLPPADAQAFGNILRTGTGPATASVAQIVARAQPIFREAADVTIRVGNQRMPATPDALFARGKLTGRITDAIERDPAALLSVLADEATDLRLTRQLRALRPNVEALRGQNQALGRFADTILQRIATPAEPSEFASMLRNVNVATLLGRAVIPNLSQSALTALTIGIRPTVRAILASGGDDAARFALRSGAILESVQDELLGGLARSTPSERRARFVLRVTGFNAVERFNRRVGAVAAREALPELIRGAARGNARDRAMLTRLGLDANDLLARGGAFTEDEALRAGQRLSRLTQFRVTPEELPEFATRGDLGRLLFQFKGFAVKAFELIRDQARLDPVGTFTRGLAVLPAAGFATRAAQIAANNALALRDPERFRQQTMRDFERAFGTNVFTFLWETVLSVGALGIVGDVLRSAAFGVEGVAEALGGPTFSLGAEAVVGAVQATTPRTRRGPLGPAPVPVQERLRPLAKQVVRRIPAFGPTVSRELFPPRTPRSPFGRL